MKLNDVLNKANDIIIESLIYKIGEAIDNLFHYNLINEAEFSEIAYEADMENIMNQIKQLSSLIKQQGGKIRRVNYNFYVDKVRELANKIKNEYPKSIEKIADAGRKEKLASLLNKLSTICGQELQFLKQIEPNVIENNDATATDAYGNKIIGSPEYIADIQNKIKYSQEKISKSNSFDPNQLVNSKV